MVTDLPAQRIAVLLQSLDGGGAQRRTVDLVNGFIAQGRQVDLILVEADEELREGWRPTRESSRSERPRPARSPTILLAKSPTRCWPPRRQSTTLR